MLKPLKQKIISLLKFWKEKEQKRLSKHIAGFDYVDKTLLFYQQ